MNRIPYVTLPLLLCFATEAWSQSATNAAGGESSGDGHVSWSVGQPFHQFVEGVAGSTSVGVQQPYVFLSTGVNDAPDIQLQLSVAPNPTLSSVRLLLDISKYEQLDYELLGVNGHQLHSARITSSETHIEMDDLASGSYYLRLFMGERTLRTVQIIKTH